MNPDHAFAVIDAANALDPNRLEWDGAPQPLALVQGQRATHWLLILDPAADAAPRLAARAHHVRRWTIPRQDYPAGRAGYLRWRRALRDIHRETVAELLAPLGVAPAVIAKVQGLVSKEGLGTDPAMQLVEDAVCLTFLETQFEGLADRLDHDRLVNAVRKTVLKMSPAAIELVAAVHLSPAARGALDDALR